MALHKMPAERAGFIADLAEDVWKAYSGERQIFLEGIADEIEVGITFDDFEDAFDGLLEHRSGLFHIFCNTRGGKQSSDPRVRFTVAHEFGHYFIDEHRNALAAGRPPHPSFTEYQSDNPAEQEANHFASNLLMPSGEFTKALAQAGTGAYAIRNVASTFNVSIQSAALRYVAGSGRRCAIIMFRDNGNPWWDVSPSLEREGFVRIRTREQKLPRDSATALAFRDSKHKRHDPYLTNTLASEWFIGVFSGSKGDVFMSETALRLGSYGVLTVLELLS